MEGDIMKTLHGFWLPSSLKASNPKYFLWAEDNIEFIRHLQQLITDIKSAEEMEITTERAKMLSLAKKSDNLDKRVISDLKISKNSDQQIRHPYTIHPDNLRDLISDLDLINNRTQKKTNRKKQLNFVDAESFKLHTLTINFPTLKLSESSYMPLSMQFLQYCENPHINSDYEQSIFHQMDRLIQLLINRLKIKDFNSDQTSRDVRYSISMDISSKISISGLLINVEHMIPLLLNIMNYSHETVTTKPSEDTLFIGEDLLFFCEFFKWIKTQHQAKRIYPKLIKQTEFYQQLQVPSQNGAVKEKNKVNNDTIIGWWYLNPSFQQQQELVQFIKSIPLLLVLPLISKNTNGKQLNPKDNDLEFQSMTLTQMQNSSKVVYEDLSSHLIHSYFQHQYSIANDVMNWLLNTIIRTKISNKIKNEELHKLASSQFAEIYFKRVLNSLFTTDIIFSHVSNSDIDWFARQFNQWVMSTKDEYEYNEWQLCLVLLPPDQNIDDDWYLSYVLRNRFNPSFLITAKMMFDDEVKSTLNYNGLEPIQILYKQLFRLLEKLPDLKKLIKSEKPEIYTVLSVQEVIRLINFSQSSNFKEEVELFLPKNLKNKFMPSNKVELKAEVNVDRNNSLKVLEYDLYLLLENEKIPLEEIIKLATTKSGLIEVRDKWIYFDQDQAKKIQELIQSQLKSSGKFDLLQMEVTGVNYTNEIENQRFSFFNHHVSVETNILKSTSADTISKIDFIKAKLRPYQLFGVSWLINRISWSFGGILADDMGLGKTLQTIAALQELKNRRQLGKVLIITPTSVLGNWMDEIEEFAPKLKYYLHHDNNRVTTAELLQKKLMKSDIILTSYNIARRDYELFESINWRLIILDEAQAIKNANTKLHKILKSFSSEVNLALTGTPMENRLSELHSIFDFLLPDYLGTMSYFKNNFLKPIVQENDTRKLDLLKQLISPFMLRRNKTDRRIIKDLPEKLEKKISCPMSKEQIALYKAITDDSLEKLNNSDGIKRRGIILATLTKLKQVCNHPANFLSDQSNTSENSGKFQVLTEILEEIIASGEKIIIFSQFTKMCQLIQEFVTTKFKVPTYYLHGGVSQVKRTKIIDKFVNQPLSAVFIISLRAGGTGLNLQIANHVIHFDRWWNPAVEQQASDRVYRIGQTKDVIIHKFITRGTIEEQIDNLIQAKTDLTEKILAGIEEQITKLDNKQIKELFQLRSVLTLD
jgi:SNF2 family DNA or RNA helicase